MNILVLSLVFPPDNVSTAHIMGNLASDLLRAGNRVSVITTTPHYNRDVEAERRQPMRRSLLPLFARSDFEGVPVLHVSMPQKQKNMWRRLVSWCSFHILSTAAALVSRPKPDVIICPSPPLTIGVSAWVIARLRGARFIYNVQEIYPDIAINLGALKSKSLIALARALERFVYRRAAAITVIAPRMEERLLARGVPREKLHVVPNFVDVADLAPLPKENEFSREYGLTAKFVVNYSGNVGPAQGLETLLSAAKLVQDDDRIRFVITGDGTEFESFRARAKEMSLSNVIILGYQPFSRMPAIYSSADICVVPQAAATGFDAVPSKVYRAMACRRAVLAITDRSSDLAALVAGAGCGEVVRPESPGELAAVITSAASEPRRWDEMAERGYRYVLTHSTREAVTQQYHRIAEQIAAS
jgi:colanic acid biosynthesis glycosyl transferase WcaI